MSNNIHVFCVSAFCSLMLGSPFLPSSVSPFRVAAVVGLSEAMRAKFGAVGPQAGDGSLGRIAQPILDADLSDPKNSGIHESSLPALLAEKLGLAGNGQRFPMREVGRRIPNGPTKYFKVSKQRGPVDIIVFYLTETDVTLFLTTADGVLIKAVHLQKGKPIEDIDISRAEVKADFEAQKSFWLKELGAAPGSDQK